MVITQKEIDKKLDLETFIPKLITTYALAEWIIDNPKVYKEYLRRNDEIDRKIT